MNVELPPPDGVCNPVRNVCASNPGYEKTFRSRLQTCSGGRKLEDVFKRTFAFITRNLKRLQNGGNVNSLGTLEIPPLPLEEFLVNALIHRDYFISAAIRVFIFDNRIEIISPGRLPNHLTVENIKRGNSNIRNPILASFATKILPCRGLGNGIHRALKAYPPIDFEDDRDAHLFTASIRRKDE